jgi:flagellar biosynthetic protein FliR
LTPNLDAALWAWTGHYAMVLLRVMGLFLFLPILGSELLPLRVRLGLAAALALSLMSLVPRLEPVPTAPPAVAVVAVRELSVGLGLGLAARMVFAGIEGAAALVAGQSGFTLASMVDPTSGDPGLAPSLFQNLLAMSLLLAADLHHVFIQALLGSYELLPPGIELPALAGLDRAASLLGLRAFAVAVELAAPALIVTVAVDLVMALVGRAMPQVPIILVGYPLKMAAGLVAMALLARTTGAAIGWIGRTIAADGAAIVALLGGR